VWFSSTYTLPRREAFFHAFPHSFTNYSFFLPTNILHSPETEALLRSYPNLRAIIAPTTVGIAAAGKVLSDKGLKGQVELTGLGLPSEMAEYIESGVSRWMYLWNPIDVGYLAGYTADALFKGTITGALGDTFEAGRLGTKEVIADGDATQIMLGPPFRFDASNIAEWKDVY